MEKGSTEVSHKITWVRFRRRPLSSRGDWILGRGRKVRGSWQNLRGQRGARQGYGVSRLLLPLQWGALSSGERRFKKKKRGGGEEIICNLQEKTIILRALQKKRKPLSTTGNLARWIQRKKRLSDAAERAQAPFPKSEVSSEIKQRGK